MKTSTKWILGIVIGLILVAAIMTIGFLAFNRWGGHVWVMRSPVIHPWEGERGMPMQPFRGIPNQRFIRFFPLRFLGSGLIFTGLLVLLILGIFSLIRSLSRPQPGTAAAIPTSAPTTTHIASQGCPSCKRPIQEDWLHCPYCGSDLTQA